MNTKKIADQASPYVDQGIEVSPLRNSSLPADASYLSRSKFVFHKEGQYSSYDDFLRTSLIENLTNFVIIGLPCRQPMDEEVQVGLLPTLAWSIAGQGACFQHQVEFALHLREEDQGGPCRATRL